MAMLATSTPSADFAARASRALVEVMAHQGVSLGLDEAAALLELQTVRRPWVGESPEDYAKRLLRRL